MKIRIRIERVMLIVLVLVPTGVPARVSASTAQQATSNVGAQFTSDNTQNLQAISQTGLLPVFAIEMNFDPSWVDGDNAPSKSATYGHNGVNDKFQSAWDKLKSAGFNTIHFALDLQDAHSATRLANLCIWAKSNNITLIPVLQNIAVNNPGAVFPAALVSALRAGDGQNAAAYTQIAYFQVETTNAAEKQKALLGSIDALRSAELKALQGSGVQPTPIIASVSFDYELVQQKAIADVPLDQATEQKAHASLRKFVMPLAANGNVDAINLAWFPRSISSGDEGHFAALLRELQAAAPEKQVLLTTGFSTAFHPANQQTQFLAVALTNLWDFRVSNGGINSHFIGVIFEQAFQGAKSDLAAPAGSGDPSQWNWSEKAQQLAQMWSGGKSPEDLQWWLNKVEANRGLLSLPSDASGGSGGTDFPALPGLQTLQQIASTFAQASQNVAFPANGFAASSTTNTATNAFANPTGIPAASLNAPASLNVTTGSLPSAASIAGASPVAGASAQSPYQQLLMALVQQVTPQITSALITKLTNHSGNGAQGQYSGYPAQANGATGLTTSAGVPLSGGVSGAFGSGLTAFTATASGSGISLGPQDVMADVTNLIPGQTAHITAQIHNVNANQDVSGLTVQLLDPMNAASAAQNMQTGVFVAHSGTTPVQLSWLAGQQSTPSVQLTVQVLDATGAMLASAPVPVISVMNSGGVNSAPTGNYSTSNFSAATTPAGSATGNIAGNPPGGSTPTNPSMTNPSPAIGVSNPAGTDSAQIGNSSSNLSNSSSTGNALVANSTGSTSPSSGNSPASQLSSAFSGPTASDGSGAGAGSGSQPSGSSSGPSSSVVPQIAYFGPAGLPGQQSTFLVQVVNPALAPMPAAQAQIYIDGKPGQTVDIGAMLPQQSRSVVFDQSLVSASNQTVKVVVTAGSQSASTTASANPKNSQIQNSRRERPAANRLSVRSGIAAQYSIGAPASTGSSSVAAAQPSSGPTSLASSTAALPSSTQTGTTAQPSGASGTQATSAAQATRSVLTGSTTAQQSSSVQLPAQTGSTVQPLGSGASTQTSKPASAPVGGSVSATTQNPSTVVSTPRTIRPPNVNSPNPTSATAQPTGSAQVSQSTQAGSPTGSPNAAPTVRTIQPAGSRTNQTTRAIQPPGSTSGGQATGTVQPSGTSASVASATQTARTIQPPSGGATSQPNAGAQTSSSATSTETARTILPPGSTASAPNRAASGAGGQNYLDLSISTADIRIAPTPQAGQVVFTALIRNLGTVSTGQASVIFRLTAGSQALAVSQPIYFSIPGSGTYQAHWTTPTPVGQNLRLTVSISAAGDVNPANNQAAFNFTAPQPVQTRH